MTHIKSKKAKNYIMNIVEPRPTPSGELIFYIEMSAKQVVEAIAIAETELIEAHAKELQDMRDKAIEAFKKACSCGRQAGIGVNCERFADCGRFKCFINELNK